MMNKKDNEMVGLWLDELYHLDILAGEEIEVRSNLVGTDFNDTSMIVQEAIQECETKIRVSLSKYVDTKKDNIIKQLRFLGYHDNG